jgi:hypothetical protein
MKLGYVIVRNQDNKVVDSMIGRPIEAGALAQQWDKTTGEKHTARRPIPQQWKDADRLKASNKG